MPQPRLSGTSDHGKKSRYGRITTLVFPLFALLFIIGSAALQLLLLSDAQAVAPTQIHGTRSPLLASSQLVGNVNPQQRVSLALGLRPRNMATLQHYVQEILRPTSPHYHHFLSPAQFATAFSPTEANYHALRAYAQGEGFTVTHTYSHRLLMTISGTLEQAERAFHVAFHTYRSAQGATYYANDQDPVLPPMAAQTVQSVVGLNNALTWHHSLAIQQLAQPHASTCPEHSNNYLTPDQIATLYNRQPLTTQHIQSEGQTLALFELSSFNTQDLTAYTACFGQAHTAIQAIPTGTTPIPADAGMLEAEMDTELVLSAVPHLAALKVYEAANNASDVLAEWSQIVQDAPPVVSTSWGICEGLSDSALVQQENVLFTAAAAQGQSIFAASGDNGSTGCLNNTTHLSADDPATQPFVTGVGGTTLLPYRNTSNKHGKHKTHDTYTLYDTEQVWNSTSMAGAGASGGGVSQYWTAPNWQTAPGVHNAYSSNVPCHAPTGIICRETPDVALHADPHQGYLAYCTAAVAGCNNQHPWIVVGGTSAAAPLWAALAVQANELSLQQGGTQLGPLNPLLYQVANSSDSYASDFHDITKGQTDLKNVNRGAYPATPGYDMATGLGSSDGFNLVKDLVALNIEQQSTRPSPVSPIWYFPEGSVGSQSQQYITLHNPHPLQDSMVTLRYLFQNKESVIVRHIVRRSSRLTVSVNSDLHIQPNHRRQVAMSTIVEAAPGIVAERSMSFTHNDIQGSTDILGATSTSLSHYFPMVDTRQQGRTYSTYLTLLNPDAHKKATAILTYYTGACGPVWQSACPTQKIEIAPLRRITASPEMLSLYQQMAASVQSDVPLVVERTLYMKDTMPQAGGAIAGATSEIGAMHASTQWRFAEGNTTPSSQEDLMLANFSNVDTIAHIQLAYDNGHSQTVNVSVPGQGQMLFDVNQANSQPTGTCDTSTCQTTPATAIAITADSPIVVERMMYYFHNDKHTSGIITTLGESGAPGTKTYAFAEGDTSPASAEALTLYNPTIYDETVTIILFVDSSLLQRQIVVKAHRRLTLDINSLIANSDQGSSEVAMTIQVQDGGQLLAERSLSFNQHGIQGNAVLIGYAQ